MSEQKIKLIYDPVNGIAFKDGECMKAAESQIAVGGTLTFSTELFFLAFRVCVKKGLIKPENVDIRFHDGRQEYKISINKDGRCPYWPQGFCNHFDIFLSKILD
jgi:hypothetical protein